MEELATRKGLDMKEVVDHLEMEMVYEIEKERDLTRNQGHQRKILYHF